MDSVSHALANADYNDDQYNLQLAAELGKSLLERNQELEESARRLQAVIEHQSQEIEDWGWLSLDSRPAILEVKPLPLPLPPNKSRSMASSFYPTTTADCRCKATTDEDNDAENKGNVAGDYFKMSGLISECSISSESFALAEVARLEALAKPSITIHKRPGLAQTSLPLLRAGARKSEFPAAAAKTTAAGVVTATVLFHITALQASAALSTPPCRVLDWKVCSYEVSMKCCPVGKDKKRKKK
ncbi:hypothetical protein BIW11_03799 [Tropilaelaps mercedesae]|uniref:Uncharacterized protein n=1 Tax=Tropilaelaps mercedesae TaxID=418985 RepID=A0A1V9XFV4_9ACAR|nr:hypothetical protein BIW11_03799 [Tropilaelaps mercedesae]